jgi:hypothetical protein
VCWVLLAVPQIQICPYLLVPPVAVVVTGEHQGNLQVDHKAVVDH